MKHSLLAILCLLTALSAHGEIREERLVVLFDSLKSCDTDSIKDQLNKEIQITLGEALKGNESFTYPFDKIPNLGKIYSDDKKVRIYTWSFPYTDRTHGYGGFIQTKSKDRVTTTPLTLSREAYLPSQQGKIAANDWYGSLYYKVFPVKNRGGNYYIALGWSGYNAASDYKLIETLNIDGKGNVSFGKMVFEKKGKNDSRIVLEYSAEAKISLLYDESSKRIIFDHLAPIEPGYKDIHVYYGPDFTYDAYQLKKGTWHLEENIDARNKR
jgi:hypothetical protein